MKKNTMSLKSLVAWSLTTIVQTIPARFLQIVLTWIAAQRARSLPPVEGLRFLLEMDVQLYKLHSELARAYGGGLHTKHRHMRYHDFFVEHVRRGERVLDIGCGLGAVSHTLALRADARVVGIDIERKNIAQAIQRHQNPAVQYIVGDALNLLPQARFDTVVLSNVLEHLPGRPQFLRRVQETAQPARMLIRVPLFERDWRVPLKRELGVEWRLDKTHETEYTLESFADEMQEAGLKIIHQEVRWSEIWAEVCSDAL
jgi:2-polyprenyl-3-methyl-5-hydroxy-6-metoxy-1,4-benzoquinol methylase